MGVLLFIVITIGFIVLIIGTVAGLAFWIGLRNGRGGSKRRVEYAADDASPAHAPFTALSSAGPSRPEEHSTFDGGWDSGAGDGGGGDGGGGD